MQYAVIYGGAPATFDAAGVAVVTNSATTALRVVRSVNITYTGVANLGADTYTDTLTITILGK